VTTPIESEMVAVVWEVVVSPGDTIAAGDVVVVLESMKMEIPVESPVDGTVTSVLVGKGDAVDDGQVLAVVD
jgi:acetyl-CoA carboxylase biotin carboxyl carrier protein